MDLHPNPRVHPGVAAGDGRGGSGSRSLSAAPYTSTSHYGHGYAVPLLTGIPGAAIRRQRIMGRSQISVRFGDGRSLLKCTPPRAAAKAGAPNAVGDAFLVNPRHLAYYTGMETYLDDLSPLPSARRHHTPSPAPRGRPGSVSPGRHGPRIPFYPQSAKGVPGASTKASIHGQEGPSSCDPSPVSTFLSRVGSPACLEDGSPNIGHHPQLRRAGVRCLALHTKLGEGYRPTGGRDEGDEEETTLFPSLSSSVERIAQRLPTQRLGAKQKMSTLREGDVTKIQSQGTRSPSCKRTPMLNRARPSGDMEPRLDEAPPGILKSRRSRSLVRKTESRAAGPCVSREAPASRPGSPTKKGKRGDMPQSREEKSAGLDMHARGDALSKREAKVGQLQHARSTIRCRGTGVSTTKKDEETEFDVERTEGGHYCRKPTASVVMRTLPTTKTVRLYSDNSFSGRRDAPERGEDGDEILEEGGPPEGYDALQIFSSAEQDTPRSAPLRSALSTTRAPTTSDDVVLLSPRKGLGFGEEDDDWFSEDGELLPKMADPYSPLPDTDPSVRKRLPFASRDPFKDYCGFPSSRTSSDSSTPTLRPGISWESGAGEIASILERQKRAGRIQRLSSSPSASEDPPCLALEEEKKENEVEALANRLLHVAKAVTDQVEMSVAVRTAQARPAGHRGDGGSARRLRARTPADQRTEREVAVDEEGEEAVARFGWFILNELREVRHADPALTRAYVHLGKVLEELRELRLASRAQKAPKKDTDREVFLDELEVSLHRRSDHDEAGRAFLPPFPPSDLVSMRSPLSYSVPCSRNPRLVCHPPSDTNEYRGGWPPQRPALSPPRGDSSRRAGLSQQSDRTGAPGYRPTAGGSSSDRTLTEGRRRRHEKSALFSHTTAGRRTDGSPASKGVKAVGEQATEGGKGGKDDRKEVGGPGKTIVGNESDDDDSMIPPCDTGKRHTEIPAVMWGVDKSLEKLRGRRDLCSEDKQTGPFARRPSIASPSDEKAEDEGKHDSKEGKKKVGGGGDAIHISINSRVQENLANERILHFMGPPVLATEEDTRSAEEARKHRRELEGLQDALEQTALLEACVQSTGKPTTVPLTSVTQHLPPDLSNAIHASLRGTAASVSTKEGLGLEELGKVKQILRNFAKELQSGGEGKEEQGGLQGRGKGGKGSGHASSLSARRCGKDGDSARSTSSLLSTGGVLEDKAPQSPLSRPGSRLRFVDSSFRRQRDARRPNDGDFSFSASHADVVGKSITNLKSAPVPQRTTRESAVTMQSFAASPIPLQTSSQLLGQRSVPLDPQGAELDAARSVTTSAASTSMRTSDNSRKEVSSSVRSSRASSSAFSSRRNLLGISSASRIAEENKALRRGVEGSGFFMSPPPVGRSGFVEPGQASEPTEGQYPSSQEIPVFPPPSPRAGTMAGASVTVSVIPAAPPQISVLVPQEQRGEDRQKTSSPSLTASSPRPLQTSFSNALRSSLVLTEGNESRQESSVLMVDPSPINQSTSALPAPAGASAQRSMQLSDRGRSSLIGGSESTANVAGSGEQKLKDEEGTSREGTLQVLKTPSGKLQAECSAAQLASAEADGPEPPAAMRKASAVSLRFPSLALQSEDTEEKYELVVSLGQLKNVYVFEEDRIPKRVFCVAHYQGQDVQQLLRRKMQRSRTKLVEEEEPHSYGCSFEQELILPFQPNSVGVRVTVMQLTLEDDILQSLPALEDFQYVRLGTTPLLLYNLPASEKPEEKEKKFWTLLNTEDPGSSTGEISVALFVREREPGAPPLSTPSMKLLLSRSFKRAPSLTAGPETARQSGLLTRKESQKSSLSLSLLGEDEAFPVSSKPGDQPRDAHDAVSTGGEDAGEERKGREKKDKKKKKKQKPEREGEVTRSGEKKEKRKKEANHEKETQGDQGKRAETSPDRHDAKDKDDAGDQVHAGAEEDNRDAEAKEEKADAERKGEDEQGGQQPTPEEEEADLFGTEEEQHGEHPVREEVDVPPDSDAEEREPQGGEESEHTGTSDGQPSEDEKVEKT